MICRDCAAFEAAITAQLFGNLVSDTVLRKKPIIRAKMQNYNLPISWTHISVANSDSFASHKHGCNYPAIQDGSRLEVTIFGRRGGFAVPTLIAVPVRRRPSD
jgi:hypothetical protein